MKGIAVTTTLALCLFLTLAIGASHASEMTKEEILAILKAMDDAYNIQDIDLVVSHYADDAIIDCPPFEPWGKEDDREFLKGFMEASHSLLAMLTIWLLVLKNWGLRSTQRFIRLTVRL